VHYLPRFGICSDVAYHWLMVIEAAPVKNWLPTIANKKWAATYMITAATKHQKLRQQQRLHH
jgi:hypothetical protein